MICRLHYAHVDGQSSQSSPAFYTPTYYPLSRTFLLHFLPAFYLMSLSHPALPLFTHSRRPTVRRTCRRRRSSKLQAKYQYLCTDTCDHKRIYSSQKNSLHGKNLPIVMVRCLCKQISYMIYYNQRIVKK